MTAHPASYWSDAIPYALLALRMTTARGHGLPPYSVITGSYPSLPSMLLEGANSPGELPDDATPEQEVAYATGVNDTVSRLVSEVKSRMDRADGQVRRRILRQER